MELQVDILARELHFQVFLQNLMANQRYLVVDTANMHIIWMGAIFGK